MRAPRRRGQALVEFLIIFPTLLLLILGAFQFALIYQAKQTLNYATFMAARQGALKNGSMNSIKDGLAAGMTPLFITSSDYGDLIKARFIGAVEAFNPLNTQVEILNPTAAAFNYYKNKSESKAEIPNDNLMYRDPGDMGSAGMSIQDANLLSIRVTYCTRLVVPIVNRVIYALYFGFTGTEQVISSEYYSGATAGAGALGARCLDINDNVQALSALVSTYSPTLGGLIAGLPTIPTTIPGINWNVGGRRIPIVATATVRMQSPNRTSP